MIYVVTAILFPVINVKWDGKYVAAIATTLWLFQILDTPDFAVI